MRGTPIYFDHIPRPQGPMGSCYICQRPCKRKVCAALACKSEHQKRVMAARVNPTRICAVCMTEKLVGEFYRDRRYFAGHERCCRTCRRAMSRAAVRRRKDKRTPLKSCVGYAEHVCGKQVRRHNRCGPCQIAHQALTEQAAIAKPLPPGPAVCGLPIRGGWCAEKAVVGYDRLGRSTIICRVHGERLQPLTRGEGKAA